MTTMDTSLLHAALVGNRGLLEDLIGFEPLGRAARLVLANGLNEQIDKQADRWDEEDLALQKLGFDPGVGQVEVQFIPNSHIHEGPHQSLMEAAPEMFPNVSVMAYITSPSPSQFDQYDTSDLTLFVETMVLAGPIPDGMETAYETIVHRRIQRTTEAVNATIRSDATLLGTVQPQRLPPRGGIGNSSWLKRQNGTGPRHLRHGSRLQYTLQRDSRFN